MQAPPPHDLLIKASRNFLDGLYSIDGLALLTVLTLLLATRLAGRTSHREALAPSTK